MTELRWEGRQRLEGCPELPVKVEINTGEAIRFGRGQLQVFDNRGIAIERFPVDYPGLDELYAFDAFRSEHPKELHAFVLVARVGRDSYAFSLVFDPFDGATVAAAGPAAEACRTVVDVFLGRRAHAMSKTVLWTAMEAFFAREDCLQDRRDYALLELTAAAKGETRTLYTCDPDAGWSRPWERIDLPFPASATLGLTFSVTEHRRRIFVDRVEDDEQVPAAGVPVVVELPAFDDRVRRVETVTDGAGRAGLRLRVGNVLRKGFVIGVPGATAAPPIGGWLLVRPPGKPRRQVGFLPGLSSRSRAADLPPAVLADLRACWDPDVDTFSDPVTGEVVAPTLVRAAVIREAFAGRTLPTELRRFEARALRRHRRLTRGEPDYGWVVDGLINGVAPAALRAAIDGQFEVWSKAPRRIWTERDARFVLDALRLAGPAPSAAVREACRAMVRELVARLAEELEPTFYVQFLRRPRKTFAASTDPVAPHGAAVLALVMARHVVPEEVTLELLLEQADHVATRHGYHDAIPDIVAHGRKQSVELAPLLAGGTAVKVMANLFPTTERWAAKLAEYRAEAFAQYRSHYERLWLVQRVDLLGLALPGVPPYFDAAGRPWQVPGARRRAARKE